MDQFNFNEFPNTDFNKVNLDWMLEQFPELDARIRALEAGGGGAAGDSIFRAVYGTTSFADIQTALNNNLLPYLEESGDYYTLLMVRPYNISFFRMSGALVWVAICNNVSGWSKYQAEYVTTQSPHFSGVPTAPTAPAGTNSSQLATTAFVKNAIDAIPQGGGGTDDYEELTNKPSINGVELIGNKTGVELGIELDPEDIQTAVDEWLDDHSASIDGLSFAAKNALLACFRHVAWIDANGEQYYNDLYNALFSGVVIESISAVFTPGTHTVYTLDSLDSLRPYLTVTANYSDSTTQTLADYELSGPLTVGTSVITVTYQSFTTTFNVTVVDGSYVSDGLVMWLDGIRTGQNGEHQTTLTTWYDQSGNNWDWENRGATPARDHVTFTGSNMSNLIRNYQSLPTNIVYMEMVLKHTSGNCVVTGFGNNSPGVISHTTSGTGLVFQTGTAAPTKNSMITIPTGSVVAASSAGYVNGEQVSVDMTSEANWQYRYPCIGAYRGSSGSNYQYMWAGEIYCLRMYSRILTAEEIQHNYEIDSRRFPIEEVS